MNHSLEQTLIACLDALEAGEPLDEILARYPDHTADLYPILLVSEQLSTMALTPSISAQARSKQAFLATAADVDATVRHRPRGRLSFSVLYLVATLFVMVALSSTLLLAVTASALPGNVFYGAKRTIEGFQLLVVPDIDFNQRRINEIEQLIELRRAARVAFNGEVQAMDTETWVIGGLPIEITDQTVIINGPGSIGLQVMVDGHTEDGMLFATTITIEPDQSSPLPSPVPSKAPVEDHPPATPTFTPTPDDDSGGGVLTSGDEEDDSGSYDDPAGDGDGTEIDSVDEDSGSDDSGGE